MERASAGRVCSFSARLRDGCTASIAWWLALASSGAAQSTGGSAGGSSWGGGGSSSGGGSAWGSSYGSSYGSGAAADAYEPPFWAQLLIAVAFLAFLFFLFRLIARASQPPNVGVASVRIALDARARRFVQASLADLAKRSDTATPRGLAELLGAASRALVAARLAWIYCGVEQVAPAPPANARTEHARLAQDARARFQNELVRNADGETRTADAPALLAREHEGEGVVVVSLIVASRASLPSASPGRPDEVASLLEGLSRLTAADLAALEVVWSPAAEQDRMSTAELEARYPELTRLTAVGGRVFCDHCRGPYAAELAKCPHCGAPSVSTQKTA